MSTTDTLPQHDINQQAFQFVQSLAKELSQGTVDIPGFPAIVTQVRQVLADESASAEKIARVVGADPILAVRILRLANSAASMGNAAPVTDLRTAISRIGLNALRSATHAHAVKIVGQSQSLRGLEKPFEVLAGQTAHVASLSYLIARHYTDLQPDTAMLAGLLQGVGRLYLLTRAGNHRDLFSNADAFRTIERDWHLSVGVALLENWEVPEEIVHAVSESEDLTREARGRSSLSDVLLMALTIARDADHSQELAVQLQQVQCLARFQLDSSAVALVLASAQTELAQLRSALS